MKNNKKTIIVILLIFVAIAMMQGKKETNMWKSTQLECETSRNNRIDLAYSCVTPCIQTTGVMKSCLTQKGVSNIDLTQNWYYFYDQSQTCSVLYQGGGNPKSVMDCVYGGVPSTSVSGSCTPGQTKCTTLGGTVGYVDCVLSGGSYQWSTNSIVGCSYGCENGACKPEPDCSTSWTPTTSTISCGQAFLQTSNCGKTRGAVGTMNCGGSSGGESSGGTSGSNTESSGTESKIDWNKYLPYIVGFIALIFVIMMMGGKGKKK